MNYKIIFDTDTDRHASYRKYVVVPAHRLSSKIAYLQAKGMIIFMVERIT